MENRQVFSETEKLFIVQQVAENKILENKKTDGATIQDKNAVWEKIHKNYCSQGFTPKSIKQLKKCWDNIKQKSRQQNTIIRQNRLLTGGGPPVPVETNVVVDAVQATIPNIDVELENIWDSNAIYEKSNTNTLDISESSSCEDDTNIYGHQDSSTPKASYSTSSCSTLREKENVAEINKIPPKKNKRALQSRNNNISFSSKKRKCDCNNMLTELQIDKIKQCIEQQKELHEQRMKTAEAETKLAILRILTAEQEIKDKDAFL